MPAGQAYLAYRASQHINRGGFHLAVNIAALTSGAPWKIPEIQKVVVYLVRKIERPVPIISAPPFWASSGIISGTGFAKHNLAPPFILATISRTIARRGYAYKYVRVFITSLKRSSFAVRVCKSANSL